MTMVGAALSSVLVVVIFLGTTTCWRGTKPETKDNNRARRMILDFAIVIVFASFLVMRYKCFMICKERKSKVSISCLLRIILS